MFRGVKIYRVEVAFEGTAVGDDKREVENYVCFGEQHVRDTVDKELTLSRLIADDGWPHRATVHIFELALNDPVDRETLLRLLLSAELIDLPKSIESELAALGATPLSGRNVTAEVMKMGERVVYDFSTTVLNNADSLV